MLIVVSIILERLINMEAEIDINLSTNHHPYDPTPEHMPTDLDADPAAQLEVRNIFSN